MNVYKIGSSKSIFIKFYSVTYTMCIMQSLLVLHSLSFSKVFLRYFRSISLCVCCERQMKNAFIHLYSFCRRSCEMASIDIYVTCKRTKICQMMPIFRSQSFTFHTFAAIQFIWRANVVTKTRPNTLLLKHFTSKFNIYYKINFYIYLWEVWCYFYAKLRILFRCGIATYFTTIWNWSQLWATQNKYKIKKKSF